MLSLLLFLLSVQRVKFELQQERWSPIPSLRRCRRRQCPPSSPEDSQTHPDLPSSGTCLEVRDEDDDDDTVERRLCAGSVDASSAYLPFRMHAAVPQLPRPVGEVRVTGYRRPRLLCARRRRRLPGPHHLGIDTSFHRRQKTLRTLRKRTAELTKALPTFTQVNRIDRLSRFVFPSLFILFNAAYWSFYSIHAQI